MEGLLMYKLILEYRKAKILKRLDLYLDELNRLEEFHYYVGMDPAEYENRKIILKNRIVFLKRKLKIINKKLSFLGQKLA